jgi:hypothetical protein
MEDLPVELPSQEACDSCTIWLIFDKIV